VRCSRRSQKSIKNLILEVQGLSSFKVIDGETTEKLVTIACCQWWIQKLGIGGRRVGVKIWHPVDGGRVPPLESATA